MDKEEEQDINIMVDLYMGLINIVVFKVMSEPIVIAKKARKNKMNSEKLWIY